MRIAEIVFYCPSLNGYVRVPVRKELRNLWHEERLAEAGTKDFYIGYETYNE